MTRVNLYDSIDEIKWLFFDVGSTLVDESKVY